MRLKTCLLLVVAAAVGVAEIREHPGGKELPHDKYLRVVSEKDWPVQQVCIRSKDGLYSATTCIVWPRAAG